MENNSTKKTSASEMMKVLNKFKSTIHRLLGKETQNVFETDYERDETERDNDERPVQHRQWYGLVEDPSDDTKWKEVAKHIEDGLKEAREKYLKCEILVPCGLTNRIARDILIMSESEPCGVRGCSLTIHFQENSSCSELVKIQLDPNTVPTFEIHLTLQEDTHHMVSVRKLMMQLTGCFKHSIYRSTPKMLCLAYKLEKLKLYRANR